MPEPGPNDGSEASCEVRPLRGPAELRATVTLYREVFGLAPTDPATSPRLLAALQRNGGSVIGAFDGGRLVGFVYGFCGRDDTTGEIYHYSQTAAVAPGMRGRGIGRALKYGQRDHVRSTGIGRMRWSFDPIRAGNARFNLDVLGAEARWFVRNLYGVADFGPEIGTPSDRLIVEWDLLDRPPLSTGQAAPAIDGAPDSTDTPDPMPTVAWGESTEVGARLLIGVPRHWDAIASDADAADASGAFDACDADRIRAAVSDRLETAFDDGWIADTCIPADNDTAVYGLRRPRPPHTIHRVDTVDGMSTGRADR